MHEGYDQITQSYIDLQSSCDTKEPQKHYSYISATQFPGMCYFNIKGLFGFQFEVFIGFKDFWNV